MPTQEYSKLIYDLEKKGFTVDRRMLAELLDVEEETESKAWYDIGEKK